jgi:hypothetical protein
LLLGSKGAGKTTTMLYLYGAHMGKDEKDQINVKRPIPKELKPFIPTTAISSISYYKKSLKFEY